MRNEKSLVKCFNRLIFFMMDLAKVSPPIEKVPPVF